MSPENNAESHTAAKRRSEDTGSKAEHNNGTTPSRWACSVACQSTKRLMRTATPHCTQKPKPPFASENIGSDQHGHHLEMFRASPTKATNTRTASAHGELLPTGASQKLPDVAHLQRHANMTRERARIKQPPMQKAHPEGHASWKEAAQLCEEACEVIRDRLRRHGHYKSMSTDAHTNTEHTSQQAWQPTGCKHDDLHPTE